jgi:Notch-like protein
MPGYSGDNCETNNNDCATANCPSSATCIDVVNAHYCRCRLGFTGEDCAYQTRFQINLDSKILHVLNCPPNERPPLL